MDDITRRALENLNEMVHTKGWDVLEEDIKEKVEELKEQVLHPTVTGELLKVAQGRILAYREILSLPTIIEAALNQESDNEDVDDSV